MLGRRPLAALAAALVAGSLVGGPPSLADTPDPRPGPVPQADLLAPVGTRRAEALLAALRPDLDEGAELLGVRVQAEGVAVELRSMLGHYELSLSADGTVERRTLQGDLHSFGRTLPALIEGRSGVPVVRHFLGGQAATEEDVAHYYGIPAETPAWQPPGPDDAHDAPAAVP